MKIDGVIGGIQNRTARRAAIVLSHLFIIPVIVLFVIFIFILTLLEGMWRTTVMYYYEVSDAMLELKQALVAAWNR